MKKFILILGIMLIGGCQAPANNSATDGMSENGETALSVILRAGTDNH